MAMHHIMSAGIGVALIGLGSGSSLPAKADNWHIGTLVCSVPDAESGGLLQPTSCRFKSLTGKRERYAGKVSHLDVLAAETQRPTLSWYVISTNPDIEPGALAGRYRVTNDSLGGVGDGPGARPGAVVLKTGSKKFTLQPIPIPSQRLPNLAKGVSEITLAFDV